MVAAPGPIHECDFYMAACYATDDAPTEPFPSPAAASACRRVPESACRSIPKRSAGTPSASR